jgi:hypothetical protein
MKAGVIVFVIALVALISVGAYWLTHKDKGMGPEVAATESVVLSDSINVPATADTLYEPAVVETARELPHKTAIIMENQGGKVKPMLDVSWTAVPGAIRYDIYSSTNPDGPYRKEKETKSLALKVDLSGQVKQKFYKIKSVVQEEVHENR